MYHILISNDPLELRILSFLGKACLLWFTLVTTIHYCLILNCFLYLP